MNSTVQYVGRFNFWEMRYATLIPKFVFLATLLRTLDRFESRFATPVSGQNNTYPGIDHSAILP